METTSQIQNLTGVTGREKQHCRSTGCGYVLVPPLGHAIFWTVFGLVHKHVGTLENGGGTISKLYK